MGHGSHESWVKTLMGYMGLCQVVLIHSRHCKEGEKFGDDNGNDDDDYDDEDDHDADNDNNNDDYDCSSWIPLKLFVYHVIR